MTNFVRFSNIPGKQKHFKVDFFFLGGGGAKLILRWIPKFYFSRGIQETERHPRVPYIVLVSMSLLFCFFFSLRRGDQSTIFLRSTFVDVYSFRPLQLALLRAHKDE